jgi:hypothetical protein
MQLCWAQRARTFFREKKARQIKLLNTKKHIRSYTLGGNVSIGVIFLLFPWRETYLSFMDHM